MTVLLTSLATQMHVGTRIAKMALITATIAVNAHRCSAFVTAGATLWTIVVGKIIFARHTDHISERTTFFRTQMTLLAFRLLSGARGGVSVPLPLPGSPSTPFDRLP
jgi:hypothetical protein